MVGTSCAKAVSTAVFRSIDISNFRCFEKLSVQELAPVTLVAGANNVGKTAFLEALFLLSGAHNPEISVRLSALRSSEPVVFDPDETWGWLFLDKDRGKPITISAVDEAEVRHQLRITLSASASRRIVSDTPIESVPAAKAGAQSTEWSGQKLLFEYTNSREEAISASARHSNNTLQFQGGADAPFPLSFYLSTRSRSSVDDARRFSSIVELQREDEVTHVLQLIDSRIRRLVVSLIGGPPSIRVDVGRATFVPLALMGEGVARVLSFTLAILESAGGLVLVDEIENGIHHSAMEKVWAALIDAAARSGTQVVATTHSWSCIESAYRAASADLRARFALMRLERSREGIQSVVYDQESLDGAMKAELEVR